MLVRGTIRALWRRLGICLVLSGCTVDANEGEDDAIASNSAINGETCAAARACYPEVQAQAPTTDYCVVPLQGGDSVHYASNSPAFRARWEQCLRSYSDQQGLAAYLQC